MAKKITPELLTEKVEDARIGLTENGIAAVDCTVVAGYVKDEIGRRCQVKITVTADKNDFQ